MKLKALVAEFIGTFALLFAGVGAAVMCSASVTNSGAALLIIALAHGIAIAVCGSAMGHISGGHFNPAVSLAMAVTKRLDIPSLLGYWLFQFAGAIVAVAVLSRTVLIQGFEDAKGGMCAVAEGVTPAGAMMLEGIGTFFLVLVIFGTAVDKRGPKMGAWLIGMTISAMILAFGPMTGCAINPARWLGPAVIAKAFENAPVWLVGPFAGAVLAALLYQHVLAKGEMDDEAQPA